MEVFNNNNDCVIPDRPVLYLPKYAYYGELQMIYRIKSVLVYKAMEYTKQDALQANMDPTSANQDIVLMCL